MAPPTVKCHWSKIILHNNRILIIKYFWLLHLKEKFTSKMKMLSSFTHPHVVPNVYRFSLCWTWKKKRKIFWRMLVISQLMVPIDFLSISFPTMEVSVENQLFGSSTFFKISSQERNSYRFGMTWGWVNDYRILIFEVNYLFNQQFQMQNSDHVPSAPLRWMWMLTACISRYYTPTG